MDKLDQHVIEIASELAQELRIELTSLNPSTERLGGDSVPPPIIVDKVGELTRNVDPHEYVPHHVSIGPYHRISSADLARDAEKVVALQAVLSAAAAAADSTLPLNLEDFVTELALMEDSVRRCYKYLLNTPSKEFLRWMLLDACFILVRFGDVARRGLHVEEEKEEPVVVGNRMKDFFSILPCKELLRRLLLDACHIVVRFAGEAAAASRVVPCVQREASVVDQCEAVAVLRDVFYLAENQIPFSVVEKIHQMTFLDGKTPALHAIARYARDLMRCTAYSVATPTVVEEPDRPPVPANLLHLLHMHFTPNVLMPGQCNRGSRGGRPVGRWRTAMEYYFAGVRFKKRPLDLTGAKGGARCILDVKVSSGGGTLEVPQLNIDAETWPLLRNLMALEQSNRAATGSHVTAYCVFMSQIACTPMDVELLSRRGIIVHALGNHGELAKHFTDLCKGAVFDTDDACHNYLRPVWQTLDRRFRSRPRRWMASLKQKHFANPWLAAGLMAAAVGLICTVIQAVYSVLSYTKPGN